jgi:hypothetical protein
MHRIPGIGPDSVPRRPLQLRARCDLTPPPRSRQRPGEPEPGQVGLIRHRRRSRQALVPPQDVAMVASPAPGRPHHDAIDRRRNDRSCMHVQTNTRTLREHRGLPCMSDRPSKGPSLVSPRRLCDSGPGPQPVVDRALHTVQVCSLVEGSRPCACCFPEMTAAACRRVMTM